MWLGIYNMNASLPTTEEIINQLFPNFWILIAHVLATIIILLVLIKFVWNPMKKNLGDRTTYIQTSIDGSIKLEKESQKNLKESEEAIIDANNRAAVIIDDSKKESFDLIEKTRIRASKLAKKITEDADISVQQQKRKFEAEMKQEVVELSLAVAQKLVQQKIAKQEVEEMVIDFLKKDQNG